MSPQALLIFNLLLPGEVNFKVQVNLPWNLDTLIFSRQEHFHMFTCTLCFQGPRLHPGDGELHGGRDEEAIGRQKQIKHGLDVSPIRNTFFCNLVVKF